MVNAGNAESERLSGLVFMVVFGLLELAVCLFFFVYLLPRSVGFWKFLTLNGALFFGLGAIFFLVYCLPRRPINHYKKDEGSYLILRPRFLNIILAAITIYAIPLLLVAFVMLVITIPWILVTDPKEVFPVLENFSLLALYESVDNATGLFGLIPLLFAFPWLYPKLIQAARRSFTLTFSDSGLKIDEGGLHILGVGAKTIPWSWITSVEVAGHGYTEVIVLKGNANLSELAVKLHPRLPKEIREQIEWKDEGVPLKLEFLRISASELSEIISNEFLSTK